MKILKKLFNKKEEKEMTVEDVVNILVTSDLTWEEAVKRMEEIEAELKF